MKIFVSIASYRDAELPKTVKSLIENAVYPDNLRVVILSQDKPKSHPEFPQYNNVEVIKMDFRKARGAGYARKVLMDQYNGEEYFFQIDSHMRFDNSWDLKLLTMFEQAQEHSGTEKVILSQFPAPYTVHTGGSDYYPKGDEYFWDKPSWTSVVNTFFGAWAGNREKMLDRSKPNPSQTVLAGYIFSIGSFVEEIPYDERISFMGEELCIAIRAYTRGWKIYAPNKMILWHFYTRKDRPKVWTQSDDSLRDTRWLKIETESKKIQENILRGKEKGIYGIGDYDKYIEYQKLIGIDFNYFYDNESKRKLNQGLLIEEITVNGSNKMSGWCKDKEHKPCETRGCECNCHNKGRKL